MRCLKRRCLLIALAAVFLLSGCVREESPYLEHLVINVYDPVSGYVGEQGGWYGHIIDEMFHITLNFLDTTAESSLQEADLLIYHLGDVSEEEANAKIKRLLEEDVILDLEPYLEQKELWAYEDLFRYWNEGFTEGGIYVIPTQISRLSVEVPAEEVVPNYGIYINWEAYRDAEYPRIRDREELLEVITSLYEKGRKEGIAPSYGISLYREEEDDILEQIARIVGAYGYETMGFAMYSTNTLNDAGILDEEIPFIKENPFLQVVEWLWEANQAGLIDPASQRQSKREALEKYEAGQVIIHAEPDLWIEGYELAPLEDMEVVSHGINPKGTLGTFVAINSHTEHPDRIVELVDWLYSAEGIMDSGTHTAGKTAGPIELTWTVTGGQPVLTEFGELVLSGEDAVLPDGWGDGTWQEGYCRLSLRPVVSVENSPSGFLYNYTLWDSVNLRDGELWEDWCARMEANSAMAYLIRNGNLTVFPAYSASEDAWYGEPAQIATLRAQCKEVIEKMIWEMIFAPDKETYEAIWEELEGRAEALGYEQVLEYDMEQVEQLRERREEAGR